MEKKNIHVIPTTPNDETGGGIWIKETRDWCNLYITSDSEIKDGDWYLDTFNTQRIKANEFSDHKHYGSACKKIILTTDQDLIKDGVQAIGHEFLEWFVNHPECEEVNVERESREVANHLSGISIEYGKYKIIIQTEEPKSLNMEKKTIEEAAEKYLKYVNTRIHQDLERDGYLKIGFLKGAEWYAKNQSEQMYSHEEVNQYILDVMSGLLILTIKEWKESKS